MTGFLDGIEEIILSNRRDVSGPLRSKDIAAQDLPESRSRSVAPLPGQHPGLAVTASQRSSGWQPESYAVMVRMPSVNWLAITGTGRAPPPAR